jgi:hypothetical protein
MLAGTCYSNVPPVVDADVGCYCCSHEVLLAAGIPRSVSPHWQALLVLLLVLHLLQMLLVLRLILLLLLVIIHLLLLILHTLASIAA